MTSQTLPFEPDPDARATRRLAVAHHLVEMGLAVAEAVQRRALAQIERDIAAVEVSPVEAAPKGHHEDPLAAVDRAARMVRLSLALAARLDSDEPVRRARARSDAAAERQARAEAEARARQAEWDALSDAIADREEILVEVATQALKQAGARDEALLERIDEIHERLDERERELDVSEHPVGAVLAKLLEAMEIAPDCSVWAAEAWAIEEARTNAPGSPYAAGGAAWVGVGAEDDPHARPEEPVRESVPDRAGSSP